MKLAFWVVLAFAVTSYSYLSQHVKRAIHKSSKWGQTVPIQVGTSLPRALRTTIGGIGDQASPDHSTRSKVTPLHSIGKINGAYVELLERGKDSVTGILQHSSFPHFLAGLVAGIMECLVGHPLDTIRIGIMTSPGASIGPLAILQQLGVALSSPAAIVDIYRGVNSEMLSAALGGAILFGVNELLKGTLNDIDRKRKAKLAVEEKQETVERVEKGIASKKGFWSSCTPELVAAAGFVGMLDGFTSKPLEMIKLRQQVAGEVSGAGAGAGAGATVPNLRQMWDIIVHEGGGSRIDIRNLFRGWLPTVIRETVGCMGFFAAYELTKVNLGNWERKRMIAALKRKQQGLGNIQKEVQAADEADEPSTGVILVAGAMAGLAYVVTSHPMENAAVLMQTDIPTLIIAGRKNQLGLGGGALAMYKYSGMGQCLSSVFSSGGLFAGLYRGAGTSVMRALPSYAASWWGYELTLAFIARIRARVGKKNLASEPVEESAERVA